MTTEWTDAVASHRSATIWEADGEPWAGVGYGHEIRRRLEAGGYCVSVVPLTGRTPDESELAADLHVLSGGTTPATTAGGWVGRARRSVEDVLPSALAGLTTVVGICFGAQLLAVTLAGPRAIRPARRGIEAGLRTVRCTASGTRHLVSEFHHHEIRPEAVTEMNGTTILTNAHSDVQAFAVGTNVVGYQFHPELDPGTTAWTTRANRHLIRSLGASPTAALGSVRRHGHRWDPASFERFVAHRCSEATAPALGDEEPVPT